MHKTLQKRVMIYENSTHHYHNAIENSTHYYHNAKTSDKLSEAFSTKTK